jgi:hypothetical protein
MKYRENGNNRQRKEERSKVKASLLSNCSEKNLFKKKKPDDGFGTVITLNE